MPGINHYENVIEAVYGYWKAKHERAGRPLIQRLWYEPPWDRKKAAQRLASSAADGEGGASEGGPFYAQDSPAALAGIRKRRMDPEEVKARFQEMRCAAAGAVSSACARGCAEAHCSLSWEQEACMVWDCMAAQHCCPLLLPWLPLLLLQLGRQDLCRFELPMPLSSAAGAIWKRHARWPTKCASARS